MSNTFQSCLKGFKLTRIVVEPNTTQSVEPDEELVDLFSSSGRGVQKPSLSSRMFVQSIEVQSRGNQGPTVTYHALNANG